MKQRRSVRHSTFPALFLAVVLLLVAGCASAPVKYERPDPESAPAPAEAGTLFQQERAFREAHGDEVSGFLILDRNEDALRWRLALIDSATQSLDLQYYLWYGDESGLLIMEHIVHAAERGVKVRVIIDDLDTMLRDAATPVVRDRAFAAINMHPNISVRLFNPWSNRSLVGRGTETAVDMKRLNQRMHNKQMIADNRVAIIGGRNLGNEYLGLNSDFNFHDLDVLAIGPAAPQGSEIFDRFWNSEWVMPVSALKRSFTNEELATMRAELTRRVSEEPKLSGLPAAPRDWSAEFEAIAKELSVGTSTILTDSPDEGAVTHHMPDAILGLIGSATREVMITNAYIIPGQKAVDGLKAMKDRGVRLRILTNSLASHDVPAVNSHYKEWRRPLIEAGVELHEMRPDAAIRATITDTPPVESEFMGLHSKGIVIDRERVFIGSANLDPRSFRINSEMGIIIESPDLAGKLGDIMHRDMKPENSWSVELDARGNLLWVAGAEILTDQPARNFSQRVQDVFFKLFPKDLY